MNFAEGLGKVEKKNEKENNSDKFSGNLLSLDLQCKLQVMTCLNMQGQKNEKKNDVTTKIIRF